MKAELRIDLDALAANHHTLASRHPGGRMGAVVKADAYGLGMNVIASRLWREGCRDFFVASADEGVTLRAALTDARIFVFEGVWPETAAMLADNRLVPVLNHDAQRDAWRAHRDQPVAVHVDTGMNRLGFEPQLDAAAFADLTVCLLVTHLAGANDADDASARAQLDRFACACAAFPDVPTSIGSTAAVLADGNLVGDVARPGIGLYGGNPTPGQVHPFRCVARFTAPVVQLREIATGTAVGYGGDFVAPRDMCIATVGAGYADGVPRLLSDRGAVSFGANVLPIVGRVSMDQTMVDATNADLAPGDHVTFFGDRITLEDVAAQAGTIGYEILTGIGPRVARVYSGRTAA